VIRTSCLASFRFLTALAESEDPEVRDLASAGTLELLLDTPETNIRSSEPGLVSSRLASYSGLGRRLELPHVLAPVTGEHLQPLPTGHALSGGATKAGLVEVGRVPNRVPQPSVRLPDLG